MIGIQQFVKAVNEMIERTRTTIRESLKDIDWNENLSIMEKSAQWGAKNGWTIPPHTTMRESHEMMNGKNKDEMDKEFELHYSLTENYGELKRKLTSNVFKGNWKELLEQCFDNYERGSFKIAIPCLFLILEGVVFTIVKDQSWKKAFVEVGKQIDKGSIERPVYISVKEFVFNSYSYGNFDNATERPSLINRSWVLHGRDDINEWQKVDALRLFNALYSLAFLKISKEIHRTIAHQDLD